MTTCKVCDKPTDLACKDCVKVRYCGTECQKADWKSHMFTCDARIYKDELNKVTTEFMKTSISDSSLIVPVKWPSGFIVNFNVMVVPKDDASNTQSPVNETIKGENEFYENFLDDPILLSLKTSWNKLDEQLGKLDMDPDVDPWENDQEILLPEERDKKMRELNEKTEELQNKVKNRIQELRIQKKIMDYLDDFVDYYIQEGTHNFYILIETLELYNYLSKVLKNLNVNSNHSMQYEPMFTKRVTAAITDFVRLTVVELPEDEFKNISDEKPKKKKKKTIHDLDNAKEEQNTSVINDILKKLTPKIVFTTCSNPKFTSFLSRNNVRFSSIKNVYIILQQLIEQNGENSLEGDGGYIRTLSQWTKLGFKIKEGQRGLKSVYNPSNKNYEKLEAQVKIAGFDESQVEPINNSVTAEKKLRKDVSKEHVDNKFILAEDISMGTLFKVFRKDNKKFPKGIKDIISQGNTKLLPVLKILSETKKTHQFTPTVFNVDTMSYDLPKEDHNKWRIAFHIMAHYVLRHKVINSEDELEAEAVALLTCNMIGIGNVEFYGKVTKSWYDGIMTLDDASYIKIIEASNELLRYIVNSKNEKKE